MVTVISGSGFQLPEQKISNEELVDAYNQYVHQFNNENEKMIAAGAMEAMRASDSDFIKSASGITQRFVFDREGILDPNTMSPRVDKRSSEQPSLQCEFAYQAALKALKDAELTSNDIDAVIVACSNFERPYPGIAVELKKALGIKGGWAFDMNAACSSAVFGISCASSMVSSRVVKRILVAIPELYTFHLNFKDRKSHFIFGDAAAALIIEDKQAVKSNHFFEILSSDLVSEFSNNIRNNFSFMRAAENDTALHEDNLFKQNGKNVREEVVPITVAHIKNHLNKKNISTFELKKLWLHQANIHMNKKIAEGVLGKEVNMEKNVPTTIGKYANNAAAGVVISFTESKKNMQAGELAMFCAFGAGYSLGSVLVKKCVS